MERSDLARLASWAVAGVLVVALGAAMLRGREGPASPEVSISGPGAGEKRAPQRASPAYVSVAGEVRRPGLVRMRAGARVGMAVRRAGGLTRRADLAGVNLAARVKDGQQVVVPRRGAAATTGAAPSGTPVPGAAGAGTAGAAAGAPKVSLATATVEQLDALDGIGPTLAQRIVRERDSRGGMEVGELKAVEGIGEKRFAALREALAP